MIPGCDFETAEAKVGKWLLNKYFQNQIFKSFIPALSAKFLLTRLFTKLVRSFDYANKNKKLISFFSLIVVNVGSR